MKIPVLLLLLAVFVSTSPPQYVELVVKEAPVWLWSEWSYTCDTARCTHCCDSMNKLGVCVVRYFFHMTCYCYAK